MAKKQISAKQVIKDIRSGMTNDELMAKYKISEKGLVRLFGKLIETRLMAAPELHHLTDRLSRSAQEAWDDQVYGTLPPPRVDESHELTDWPTGFYREQEEQEEAPLPLARLIGKYARLAIIVLGAIVVVIAAVYFVTVAGAIPRDAKRRIILHYGTLRPFLAGAEYRAGTEEITGFHWRKLANVSLIRGERARRSKTSIAKESLEETYCIQFRADIMTAPQDANFGSLAPTDGYSLSKKPTSGIFNVIVSISKSGEMKATPLGAQELALGRNCPEDWQKKCPFPCRLDE